MLSNKLLAKTSKFHNLEPRLYSFVRDIVEAMKTLFQQSHSHSENRIAVKVF